METLRDFKPRSEVEKKKRHRNSDVGGSRPRTRNRIQQQFYDDDSSD
jgi:hypothetical protein